MHIQNTWAFYVLLVNVLGASHLIPRGGPVFFRKKNKLNSKKKKNNNSGM